jgi:hypothetical protein
VALTGLPFTVSETAGMAISSLAGSKEILPRVRRQEKGN